jgi:hypothetical protein
MAKHNLEETLKRSVPQDMASIPAGMFLMGSNDFIPRNVLYIESGSMISGSTSIQLLTRPFVPSWNPLVMSPSPNGRSTLPTTRTQIPR